MRNTHHILASGIAACPPHLSYFFCLPDGVYIARTSLKSCREVLLCGSCCCATRYPSFPLLPLPQMPRKERQKAAASPKVDRATLADLQPTPRCLVIPSQHPLPCTDIVIIAQPIITDSAQLINEKKKPLHPGVCKGEQLIVMDFSAAKAAASSNPSGRGLIIALISPARVWGPSEDAKSVAIHWRGGKSNTESPVPVLASLMAPLARFESMKDAFNTRCAAGIFVWRQLALKSTSPNPLNK